MTQIAGHSYATFYHPEEDRDEWCEVKIDWVHSYDYGKIMTIHHMKQNIDTIRVLTINGKAVPRETELPNWVTQDQIMESIDIRKDGYEQRR